MFAYYNTPHIEVRYQRRYLTLTNNHSETDTYIMVGARTCIYACNKRSIMTETNLKTHMCHIINGKFITGGCATKIILGLFATAPIPQQQVIGIYVGVYQSDTRQNKETPMDDQFTFPEYNMSLDTCAPYGDMYIN